MLNECGTISKTMSFETSLGETNSELRSSRACGKCDEVYDFQQIIGEGTFSTVVKATHNASKVARAIKVIDLEKMQTGDRQWRIQNEITLHKRCQHAHIVKLHETFESEVDACLVMELCGGGELFERIVERGYFAEHDAARTMRQITSAVSAMHALGIVHRDIKPENLLFASSLDDSDIKLTDFGMAKAIEHNEHAVSSGRAFLAASSSGTTAYCAPERLAQSHESKAVDLWSLGCILYFMLFGVPPFYSDKEDEDDADEEIIERVMKGQVHFPENRPISALAKDVILRLLDPDPACRLSADELLHHPWLNNACFSTTCVAHSPIRTRTILRSTINKVTDHETR
eukprot:TRINITY_DN4187_c1_g1_i1.p1 TRINITY_DN4187_c1_g1~~TRINITY_DN4187_c1_g1_i1.p1  ORF type:complete len:344 (-),score=35.06 TRINITY_DN4187_c1_g1_i1:179-1210(-)